MLDITPTLMRYLFATVSLLCRYLTGKRRSVRHVGDEGVGVNDRWESGADISETTRSLLFLH